MKRIEQKATAVLSHMTEILEISTEIDTPFTLSLISMHSLLYISNIAIATGARMQYRDCIACMQ